VEEGVGWGWVGGGRGGGDEGAGLRGLMEGGSDKEGGAQRRRSVRRDRREGGREGSGG